MSSEGILIKTRPDISVLDFSRGEIIDFLREKLSDKEVINAWLIGSCAAGTASPWSDIDVVIVKKTALPFPERSREFAELMDLGVPVDIFVYTPHEAKALDSAPTSFWKTSKRQRVRIL